MGRDLKGKICVYCGTAISDTKGDHVFARAFFLESDRGNLPQVPACKICGGVKASLELYATTVLPLVGRHETAKANLETLVPPRLQKNLALKRELAKGADRRWLMQDSGLIAPTLSTTARQKELGQLFEFIGKGLIWYHWQVYLHHDDVIEVSLRTTAADQALQTVFDQFASQRIQKNFGNGTVQYEGLRDPNSPRATAWRIRMLGGIHMSFLDAPEIVYSSIYVCTKPRNQEAVVDGVRQDRK
jgi:hypothetical protein